MVQYCIHGDVQALHRLRCASLLCELQQLFVYENVISLSTFMFEASVWRCFMHSDCSYKTHETPRRSETERYHQWKHFLCLNQMRCSNWKCSNLLLEFPTLLFFLIFRTKLHKYNILHMLYLRNSQVNSLQVSSLLSGLLNI